MPYLLLAVFIIKHYIAEIPIQNKYMYSNKGKYLHPGGLIHSHIHGSLTLWILLLFRCDVGLSLSLSFVEMFFHYHIDYFKVVFNEIFKCSEFKNSQLVILGDRYFSLMLLDQCLHMGSYMFIVWVVC